MDDYRKIVLLPIEVPVGDYCVGPVHPKGKKRVVVFCRYHKRAVGCAFGFAPKMTQDGMVLKAEACRCLIPSQSENPKSPLG